MRGQTRSVVVVSFTSLSVFLVLGLLAYPSSPSSTTQSHELTFTQEGTLSPLGPYLWLPWSITLSGGAIGSITESNPPDTKITECPAGGISSSNLGYLVENITFDVPYGLYHYEVETAVGPMSGQVDFSASNALPVHILPKPCCTTC